MKKVLMLTLLLAFMGSFLGGCAGLAETDQEQRTTYKHIWKSQERMFWDDWDMFWLHDTSSQLTPWYFQVGN